jgi:hypothetical protein
MRSSRTARIVWINAGLKLGMVYLQRSPQHHFQKILRQAHRKSWASDPSMSDMQKMATAPGQ